MFATDTHRAFVARVTELGGEVLEPQWLGNTTPHRIRCKAGHETSQWPKAVRRNLHLCPLCYRHDPKAAEATFRTRIAGLGGEVLEPKWLGRQAQHHVRCAAGHACSPRPADVDRGQGICRTCAGKDPTVAEAAFRKRVGELGGTVLEPTWMGALVSHQVQCANGHLNNVRPSSVQQGRGLCRTCVGKDSRVSKAAFCARVGELGGTVLEPTWLGIHAAHRVRCAAGHEAMTRPANVRNGQGICRRCAGQEWDVFYVVADDDEGHVKFGITSGDPRPRLREHARHDFTRTVRLLTGLPDGVALSMEQAVKATLKLAGEKPIRGREYFDVRVLPTVLDIVDQYPITRLTPAQFPSQGESRGSE